MRVLLSPGAERMPWGAAAAAALAGDGAETVRLTDVGVRTVRRRLSQAEVHSLRKALLGLGPGEALALPAPPSPEEVRTVGYVCSGRAAPPGRDGLDATAQGQAGVPELLAVTDHANLTWRSPLTGPNDDRLGPRFPVVAGLYRPELVLAYWESAGTAPRGADAGEVSLWRATPVATGVVAEVADDEELTAFERAVVEQHGFPVVTSELAAVAIVAAHLGLKLAAGVVVGA